MRKGTPSIIALHRRLLPRLQHFRVAAKEVYDSTIFSEKSGLPKVKNLRDLVIYMFRAIYQSAQFINWPAQSRN